MDFTLVSGRFTAGEAETLLSELVRVKTDFHIAKIDTINHNVEDIEHAEKRIRKLERELHKMLDVIKSGNYEHVALHATMSIGFVPDYQGA